MTFLTSPAIKNFAIDLSGVSSFTIPIEGVGDGSVGVSLSMANNGILNGVPITSVTQICSLSDATVYYASKIAGENTEVTFQWSNGLSYLKSGDSVFFKLTDYDSSLGTKSRYILVFSYTYTLTIYF